ncbi:hypothetical protein ABD87_22695 [Lysinibacillus sphaericus]|uniref:DUF2786 domain-containing protein n=1 Tax=Lysinibacillus sphaericus TaxID=1421 RepID=UPI0018CE8BA0|nr:DUF2786 domain-containing protein [Lysinibacillus sphaericus]MBG9732236.1 hypothetical protein [Lysinibacillus sphaericus]
MNHDTDEKQENIIRKVDGLLAKARDNANDRECQSAFLQAQKLMMKYKINEGELQDNQSEPNDYTNVKKVFVTPLKSRISGWEIILLNVFSENFPVKSYLDYVGTKRGLRVVGLKEDVDLVHDLYILAIDTVLYFSKQYVGDAYQKTNHSRSHTLTNGWRDSYINDFISGLKEQFEEQIKENPTAYELAILTPTVVNNYIEESLKLKEYKRKYTEIKIDTDAYSEGKIKDEIQN